MLTDSQRKTLNFIRVYIANNGYAPKLQEIAEGIGIRSRGVVHRYVQALVDAGYVENTLGKHRGLRLREKTGLAGQIPFLGRIAAGKPIEAIPEQDEISLPNFFTGEQQFAVRVVGDSMIEMGILDGDIVIIESRDTAKNGEVVVALIDNEEATLKQLEHTNEGLVRLIPANQKMEPMLYQPEQVRIQGVLVGSLRRY
ncbi:MAG: transcriptional repressor LexA [Gammaproteobacteria bacterium]|nr:transcriptional repressor LexA [Gammaproteobacteria bacterium]